MDNLRQLVAAFVFASDSPLSLDRLSVLSEQPKAILRPIIEQLKQQYAASDHGFFLAEVAGGYQFRTIVEFAPWLRKLNKERATRFSRAALETLAITSYRQPVTRAEIEYLRGVDSGGVMKTLLDKNLLRILGKKDAPGRPLMYGTSRQFLELFGLRDLNDLPTLKEFAALAPVLAEADPLSPDTVE
jgi:segregation and condensation protein B